MTQKGGSEAHGKGGMTAGLCFLAGAVAGALYTKIKLAAAAEPPIRVSNPALDIRLVRDGASWAKNPTTDEWSPSSYQEQEFAVFLVANGGRVCQSGDNIGKRVDIFYGGEVVHLKKAGKKTFVYSNLPLTSSGTSLGHPGNDGDFITRIELRKNPGGGPDWCWEFDADEDLDEILIMH